MKLFKPLVLTCALLALQASGAPAADKPLPALNVARFTQDGKLLKPEGLENWVFVGSALGMGYNEAQFNPAAPGLFQVVQVEPAAFRYFMANGHFAPGSMMLLSFYGADTRVSNNKTGYVQSALRGQEIHLIDPARKADGGHVFYGAFEGTFIQFYPVMSGRIPKEALAKALADHDIR
jgi:hypothetical protein